MEVFEFLKLRTAFIRRHYTTASEPFREIIRKIEAEEPPYEPPYSEDDEPPFLEEWIDANRSLEVLGATCVSMLSEALKLYFQTWNTILHIECQRHCRKEFNQGFVNGYRACFGHVLKTDWSDCPADFNLIEQIALARNDAQHPKEITELGLRHNPSIREKHARPFFLNDHEKRMIEDDQYQEFPWSTLSLVVTRDSLFEAIGQVEVLAEWLEEPLFDVKYGRR